MKMCYSITLDWSGLRSNRLRMVYDKSLQMIGHAFICGLDLHSIVDDVVLHAFENDPTDQYYGTSLLRGSRQMRIASSLDLCPKVIGIDHPAMRSCVLQVVLRQRIKKIEVLRQRIKKIEELLQRIKKIEVLLQRIEKIEVLLQRIKKIEVLLQRIKKIEVLLQRIKNIEVLLQGIRRLKCCCKRIK